MKLKGKARIELTDVNTGEVQVVEEENMVTNAVAGLFSHNIEGLLFNIGNSAGSNWSDYHLPVCPNAIGGILLFSEALEEDADNIYPPSDNACIGYASNDVNSTENVMRGSLNLTESGRIDRGYRFVWDFTTSQANGIISAVALTHKMGGIGFFGDTYDAGSRWLRMKDIGTVTNAGEANYYTDVVEINFDGNYMYSISVNTETEIIITKIRKCFRQIGLNFSLLNTDDEVLETQTITPSDFFSTNKSGYADFIDGEDGYWYGFAGSGNPSGNATVKWIRIDKSDHSYTEGTWTFEGATLYSCGQRGGYGTSPSRSVYTVIRNGYVYFMHYQKTGVYKVKLDNSADITFIPFGFTSKFSGNSNYGTTYVWKWGDRIMGSDFIINVDDSIVHTANNNAFSYACTPMFQYGPYGFVLGRCLYYGNYSIYKGLWVVTPYLASINNLDTAVIKTADRTMKITYTITETE